MVKYHFLLLEGCIYHTESPVNLQSTRQLNEKFLDANVNPYKETRIESRYSTHTLKCFCEKYKRIFPTPVSGLLELMFDEGFTKYNSYCA